MSTTDIIIPTDGGTPSGYSLHDEYVVQAAIQGGRLHYSLVLPLAGIASHFPVPDPESPFEDNRKVRLGHAQAFADYIRNNEHWHSGPLTIRTSSAVVGFYVYEGGDNGVMKVGCLKVPRNSRDSFRIIDGQHRILGIALLFEQLNNDRVVALDKQRTAEQIGEAAPVVDQFRKEVKVIEEVLRRIERDCIAIDLVIEDNTSHAKQVFVDVAENALGITKSVSKVFDRRRVVNRALNKILSDPNSSELFQNKVDLQLDRITGGNPNLLGASHLADIIKILAIGLGGRMTESKEALLDEGELVAATEEFCNVLVVSFPDLAAIYEGTKTPNGLRGRSILVSTTMLRVLAGVYHELRTVREQSTDDITAFFGKLAPRTHAPVTAGSPSGDLWLSVGETEPFTEGAAAPGARAQQVKELVAIITGWYGDPPAGL